MPAAKTKERTVEAVEQEIAEAKREGKALNEEYREYPSR